MKASFASFIPAHHTLWRKYCIKSKRLLLLPTTVVWLRWRLKHKNQSYISTEALFMVYRSWTVYPFCIDLGAHVQTMAIRTSKAHMENAELVDFSRASFELEWSVVTNDTIVLNKRNQTTRRFLCPDKNSWWSTTKTNEIRRYYLFYYFYHFIFLLVLFFD